MICAALLHCTGAWAGGILIYEAGQEGNGLANAGSAALANEPSVLMSNPAGITKLQGTQVSANAQVILGSLRFSRDSANQFDGNEGGNALEYLPGASLFISHQLDERSAIGFGMYGNFGLALDYDDWAGRYFTQEAAVIGVSLQPTWAYKLTEDLSIGVGPRIMLGYYRTEMAIDNNLLGLADRPDGQLEYKDTDIGTGVNLGLLYQLDARPRIGLAYTSKVKLEFEDKPHLKDISNPLLQSTLQGITQYYDQTLKSHFAQVLPLATSPGPGVLVVRPAITAVSAQTKGLLPYEVIPIALLAAGISSATGIRDQDTSIATEAAFLDGGNNQVVAK